MSNKVKIIIITAVVAVVIITLLVAVLLFMPKKQETVTENKNEVSENVVSNETDENATEIQEGESKITETETSDGSKIPVPEGFTYKEGTVSTGAVISDEQGNEFVWVPTDNILFVRRDFNNPNTAVNPNENSTGNTTSQLTTNTNFAETQESNKEYIDSVNKYKGFYIGRYEASKNEEDDTKACTKKGVEPLTEIVYDRMRKIAQNTYADNNSVQSDICSSYAWDTLCVWLQQSGYDIYNSTNYGNYKNNPEAVNRKATTGRNSKWVTNNIYDLAGNVWEISTEEWGEVYHKNHTGRGGGFNTDGIRFPLSCRVAEYDGSYAYIGFRLVLYLK